MQVISFNNNKPNNVNNCSFKANEYKNNKKRENNKSNKVQYLIGATILAGVVAVGIIYHKQNPFNNSKEATKYFKKKFNIDVNFNKSEDIEYIKSIKEALEKLKKQGCKMPKTIDFCSFKDDSINILRKNYGLKSYDVPTRAFGHADDGIYVFFNTEAPPLNNIINKINNEKLGHFKTESPSNKEIKEYIAIHEFGHINARKTILDYGYKSEHGELPNNAVDNIIKNIDRYKKEMKDEVKPLSDGIEIIPETFAKLIMDSKLEFSDKTMLLYDVMGGGAIPNKIIKGKPYAEYMQNLYKNWQEILV